MQDKRPKQRGRIKKDQDPIEGLPMMAKRLGYADGLGNHSSLTQCFKQYCPDCQTYWNLRLSAYNQLDDLVLRQARICLVEKK